MKTELQFNPDYYRIINLEEESKEEDGYGIDAKGAQQVQRKSTQPKLEFPVREKGFSDELLRHKENEKERLSSSSGGELKEADEVDNWLSQSK